MAWTALTVPACQNSSPPAVHTHRFTATVTVTDTALLPEAAVEIPVFATVVWRNRGSAPAVIDVDTPSCPDCDTVLGFTPTDHGTHTAKVDPGDVVTLCFHTAGVVPFVARIGSAEHRGTVLVGGAK
ncbi:MAG: hypothetical protein ABIP94_04360 [Planctomycetota bacterium]